MFYELAKLNREKFQQISDESIVIVPLGSLEQHGPHLPLITDSAIVEKLVEESVETLEGVSSVVLTPTVWFGSSHHHLFSVAISLSVETYIEVLRDIVRSLVKSGVRRILFINGHGGNDLAMKLVTNDVILENNVIIGAFSYWNPDYTPGHDGDLELGHAGMAETSLMLFYGYEVGDFDGVEGPQTTAFFDKNFGSGVVVNRFGEWKNIAGVTTSPEDSSYEAGQLFHARRVKKLQETIIRFDEETR